MRIRLGPQLGVVALLAGLVACAPHSSVDSRLPAVTAGGVSPSSQVSNADWCFQGAVKAVAKTDAERQRARLAQGFAWLTEARRRGDPGYLVQAAACADLPLVAAEPVPLADTETGNLLRLQVLMGRHEFAVARDFAKRWISEAEAPPLAHLLLSDCLLELGEIDAATAEAQVGMQARPDQNAYARAAHLRWLHGDIESAKLIYADILRNRDPGNPEASAQRYLELAKLVAIQGDIDGAKKLVAAGLVLMPDHRDSLLWLARTELASGDLTAAETALQSLATGFVDIPVLALRRDLAAQRNDAAAVAAANAEIDRLGARGEAWALAQDLLARKQNPEQVLRLLQTERRSRDGLAFAAAEADARLQLGQAEAALKAIDRALRYGTAEPNWLALRADILLALNRPKEAKLALARVAALRVFAKSSPVLSQSPLIADRSR